MKRLKIIALLALAFISFTSNLHSSHAAGEVINEKLQMAENNPVANTFCRVYDTVLVTAFVVAAILWTVTGIGFFIGKISWGVVVAIGVGSALTVGSSKLAAKFVFGTSDITDACDCRHGVNCESPYE